ncbi:DegT/DnrJ/EryC1/StrS family aminotransferase, partial [bacterium]|nr:DegT/DnrJ/EryC1/StrS family aminotransferase [bacterium]
MQKIPLVDLKAQYFSLKTDIDRVVFETMSQTAFIMGDRVTELESDFAAYCGVKFGIGVSSATCG